MFCHLDIHVYAYQAGVKFNFVPSPLKLKKKNKFGGLHFVPQDNGHMLLSTVGLLTRNQKAKPLCYDRQGAREVGECCREHPSILHQFDYQHGGSGASYVTRQTREITVDGFGQTITHQSMAPDTIVTQGR